MITILEDDTLNHFSRAQDWEVEQTRDIDTYFRFPFFVASFVLHLVKGEFAAVSHGGPVPKVFPSDLTEPFGIILGYRATHEQQSNVAQLQQKIKEQDDEIVVLKSALANVVRRLEVLETERSKYTGSVFPNGGRNFQVD